MDPRANVRFTVFDVRTGIILLGFSDRAAAKFAALGVLDSEVNYVFGDAALQVDWARPLVHEGRRIVYFDGPVPGDMAQKRQTLRARRLGFAIAVRTAERFASRSVRYLGPSALAAFAWAVGQSRPSEGYYHPAVHEHGYLTGIPVEQAFAEMKADLDSDAMLMVRGEAFVTSVSAILEGATTEAEARERVAQLIQDAKVTL